MRKQASGSSGRPGALLLLPLLALLAPAARGQFTETAWTVAPGEGLFEADLVNFGRMRGDDFTASYWAAAYLQYTRGWRPGVDVQVAVQALQGERVRWHTPGSAAEQSTDPGGLYLRGKLQLWNGDAAAVALLPYVHLPLASDERGHRLVDLGFVVPFSRTLGEHWAIDLQLLLEGRKDDGHRRRWHPLLSTSVQRTLRGPWATYAEVIADLAERRWERAAVAAGLGVTYASAHGITWDLAVYQGVTAEAMEWEGALRVYWEL